MTDLTTELVIPAKAGIQVNQPFQWIPAFAGMTSSDSNVVIVYGNINNQGAREAKK